MLNAVKECKIELKETPRWKEAVCHRNHFNEKGSVLARILGLIHKVSSVWTQDGGNTLLINN